MRITLSEADSFDRALECAVAGDEIVLCDGGLFETHGPWASPGGNLNVASGVCIHAGTATIRLVAPVGITRQDRDLPILRAGAGVVIHGGTWDANHAQNPAWYCQGMRFHGQFRVCGAIICGMSGSRASGTPSGAVESFAISSEGDTGGSVVEEVTVRDCKSEHPDDYVSGIFMGATGDVATALESIVRNCVVRLGPHGQFAYSSNGPTLFRACAGEASRFWYNDTGHSYGVRLIGCTGRGNYAAVSCIATPGGEVRQVQVVDCRFDFPRGIEWWDQAGSAGMSGGVVSAGSQFKCQYPAAISAKSGGVEFRGCTFPYQASPSVSDGSILPVFITEGTGAR